MIKPTTKRVPVSLEEPLYRTLADVAARDRLSISQKARDLIRHALEIEEDEAFEALVHERMRHRVTSIAHDDFWKQRAKRRTGQDR